ncbi:MAG: hypothetical protein LC778_10415, partial [Acidobacteria bacterium]|nr:hypothetical protein [Acidobacteriota bacterium]
KPPANLLESLIVQRNNKTGALTVIGDSSDWTWFFTEPHTTAELTAAMFPGEQNKANEQKARRKIEELLARQIIVIHSETLASNGRKAKRYMMREPD